MGDITGLWGKGDLNSFGATSVLMEFVCVYVCGLDEAPPTRGTVRHQSWSAERHILGPGQRGIPHGQISDPIQPDFVNTRSIKIQVFLKLFRVLSNCLVLMYLNKKIKK